MRRKRDRPRRPLGVQGTCWPRRVLTAPPRRLELREAPRSRGGGGAARALERWRDSRRSSLSLPPTRLRPLREETPCALGVCGERPLTTAV